MSERFDVHAVRHRLKQLSDSGDTRLFENRDGVQCPACDDPFTRLFTTRRVVASFPGNAGAPFCLLRDDEVVHLFIH